MNILKARNANLKEIAMNVTTLKSSAMQFASRIIQDSNEVWNERFEELSHDAKALRDAVVVRFSTDPQVLHEMDEKYWSASEEDHTSLAPEDCVRTHRRYGWVRDAVANRLVGLAKRWGLPEVSLVAVPITLRCSALPTPLRVITRPKSIRAGSTSTTWHLRSSGCRPARKPLRR